MQDYLLTISLLCVPILLGNLKAFRKGLILGLIVSLFFWGKMNPLLSLIPLVSCFIVYFITKNNQGAPLAQYHYIKNPSFPMMTTFIASMAVFCAFDHSFTVYGEYLNVDPELLQVTADVDILAYILGPIFFGNFSDRKGPFPSAVMLTLVAEGSVLLAAFGHGNQAMFVMGSFFLHFCSAAFFVVMPMVISACYGEGSIFRIYPTMAFTTATFWVIARFLYLNQWKISYNPGDFLISLILLTIISALFLFIAWKRRFILVMAKR